MRCLKNIGGASLRYQRSRLKIIVSPVIDVLAIA